MRVNITATPGRTNRPGANVGTRGPERKVRLQLKLRADGRTDSRGTAMVCHNERLADPLDSITQALAEITGKRKKAIEDHQEIARREFFGGLYTDPVYEWPLPGDLEVTVGLPAWNVLRCLQEGAKRHKRGPDILRGVSPIVDFAPVTFEHPLTGDRVGEEPINPQDLWREGQFSLRKSVGVQRSRTMRTRPIFKEWELELDVEVDPTVLDVHTIRFMWKDAGLYAGLGEMRPVYGKFNGTLEVVHIDPEEAKALESIPTDEDANGTKRATAKRTRKAA